MTSSAPARVLETINDDLCREFVEHLEFVGRRWTGAILLAGLRGARRFSEYRTLVEGISDRLLSARLKELETEGLMSRTVVPTTPVTITYEPTPRGRSLIEAVQPLAHWALDDRRRGRLRPVSD